MANVEATRAEREIAHGKKLVENDPESTWGWATPAGRRRARRRAQLIVGGAGLGPGMRVLEVGCGTGLFTEMFVATGAHIVAVDISPELVERAAKRGLPRDRVVFLAKAFEECAVDGPFDAVIGNSILHHLVIDDALVRIATLLRPGGSIGFAEPNLLNPQILVQKNVPFIKRLVGESPDETAFVRWRLAHLLSRTGYDDIRIQPFDWLHPATPASMIEVVERVGRWLERIPVAREFAGSLFIRARRE
jgi:2-polyprenyl-3-methyl-5-hydroxy-6-metoxy-1,4-benzoquinol methylase